MLKAFTDSEGMRVPHLRDKRMSAATIGNFMNKELMSYLANAGIDAAKLSIALNDFLINSDVLTNAVDDIDSLLIYLQKETIQDFIKLLK